MMRVLYSNLNLILSFVALFDRSMAPYAFINTLAIFNSFHVGMLMEPPAYHKLLKWNGVSPVLFWVGDFVVHGLPLCFYFVIEKESLTYAHGLITASAHLSWAYLSYGTLFLDHVYVPMSRSVWIAMWLVSITTHLGVPLIASHSFTVHLGASKKVLLGNGHDSKGTATTCAHDT